MPGLHVDPWHVCLRRGECGSQPGESAGRSPYVPLLKQEDSNLLMQKVNVLDEVWEFFLGAPHSIQYSMFQTQTMVVAGIQLLGHLQSLQEGQEGGRVLCGRRQVRGPLPLHQAGLRCKNHGALHAGPLLAYCCGDCASTIITSSFRSFYARMHACSLQNLHITAGPHYEIVAHVALGGAVLVAR